jgi:hypothetical protein
MTVFGQPAVNAYRAINGWELIAKSSTGQNCRQVILLEGRRISGDFVLRI